MKPITIAGHKVNPVILLAAGGALVGFVLLQRARSSGQPATLGAPAPAAVSAGVGLSGTDLVDALLSQQASSQGNIAALGSDLQALQATVLQLQSQPPPAPPAPTPSLGPSPSGSYVIGTNRVAGGYGIYDWSGSAWQQMPGGGVRVWSDTSGVPWVVNSFGQIYKWGTVGSAPAQWIPEPGKALVAA